MKPAVPFRPFATLTRQQYPVGQGGFHAATLHGPDGATLLVNGSVQAALPGRTSLSWVYDCGSEKPAAIEAEVDNHLAGAGPWLDILFLSHFDGDHMNGIERLLAAGSGLNVGTIALPYLDHAERAYVFARHVAAGAAVGKGSFLRRMTIDPVATLAGFGPRRILLFRPGEHPDPDPDFRLDDGPSGARDGPGWKLVGRGGAPPQGRIVQQAGGLEVAEVSDSAEMYAPVRGAGFRWVFKPYVRPADRAHITAFLAAAAQELKWDPLTIETKLADLSKLKALVTSSTKSKALGAAYLKVFKKPKNRTSLCVYAGPLEDTATDPPEAWAFCFDDMGYVPRASIGWLGTGDAVLKTTKWSKQFLAHYQAEVSRTRVLQLPHHGSAENSNASLLGLKPVACVASAWPSRGWAHPAKSVTAAVTAAKMRFEHVTYARRYLEGFIFDAR